MFRIGYKYLFFIIISITVVLFLNGCGTKTVETFECSVTSDCSQKTCSTVSCVGNQCVNTPIPNCCGNNIQEEIEDGKPGNQCTCSADYGACEGRGKVKVGSRTFDAEYLRYFCENDVCVLGVPEENVRSVTLLTERDFNLFKLETTVTFNEPFDVAKDTFTFRVSVLDDSEDIVFPIKLTKLILKDGEILFGEKQLDSILTEVGDSVTMSSSVSYSPQEVEEVRRLSYQINYEYKKSVRDKKLPNGTYTFKSELVRDDYQERLSSKITFLRSGTE